MFNTSSLVNWIESQHYTTNGSNIGNTDIYRDGMVCDGVCLDDDNGATM